jgi:hypothetical protein
VDNSKLPKMTNKSSESPWEPSGGGRGHERKRLSDRAGTTGKKSGSLILPFPASLAIPARRTKNQKSWKGDKVSEGTYTGGKYPGTNKPGTGSIWRFGKRVKDEKNESEY